MSDTGHVPTGGATEQPLATTGAEPAGAHSSNGDQPARDPFGADASLGHNQVLQPSYSSAHSGAGAGPGMPEGGRLPYTFLDLPDGMDEDDEDELLMPGPQGSWSEPQALQPQAPVQADAGDLRYGLPDPTTAPPAGEPIPPSWPPLAPPSSLTDLGTSNGGPVAQAFGDDLPGGGHSVPSAPGHAPVPEQQSQLQPLPPAPSQPQPQQALASPRRPLHAGPPIPDPSLMTGQVPVRSLADRGPSGAGDSPFTVPAVQTPPYGFASVPIVQHPGPEYLDQPESTGPDLRTGVGTAPVEAAEPEQSAFSVPVQLPSPESTLGANRAHAAVPVEATAQPEPGPGQLAQAAPAVMAAAAESPAAGTPAVAMPAAAELPAAVTSMSGVPAAVPAAEYAPRAESAPQVPLAEPVPEPVPVQAVAQPQVEPVPPAQTAPPAQPAAPDVGGSRISAFMAPPPRRYAVEPDAVGTSVAASAESFPRPEQAGPVASEPVVAVEPATSTAPGPSPTRTASFESPRPEPTAARPPLSEPPSSHPVPSHPVQSRSGVPEAVVAEPVGPGIDASGPVTSEPFVPEPAVFEPSPPAPAAFEVPSVEAATSARAEVSTAEPLAAAAPIVQTPVVQVPPVEPAADPAPAFEPAPPAVSETTAQGTGSLSAPDLSPVPPTAPLYEAEAQPVSEVEPQSTAVPAPRPQPELQPEPQLQPQRRRRALPVDDAVEAAQPLPAAAPASVPVAPSADLAQPAAEPLTAPVAAEAEELPEPAAYVPEGPAAPAYDDEMREAVHRVMRERRDIRNGFRPDPIPHDVLIRVLEAAHTAPSVGYSQPWDFVVIRSAKTRNRMHQLAERQRAAYAASLPKGRAKQFKELKIEAILETPVNIVVTADRTRGGRHTLGRHTQPQMAPYSAALAVENLWLAARAEGLGVGWVSFFDEQEMVRELGLPEHLDVVAYLCVGYVNEFPSEPELAQAGWAKKRPLSWVVHEETYGRRALPGEEPHSVLQETLRGIRPLDAKALGEAWDRQKRMTKPAGSLGMLEIISAQLCGLSRKCPPPVPEPACVAIFAGDHGVHAQGVTNWPQEVTAQMVGNFLNGGAVVNAFATQIGAEVCVVDVGVAGDLPAAVESGRTTGLLPRKIRPGTADMTVEPAMTREEALRAIEVGIETARDLVAAGNKGLVTGDMGIANTTAAAALICVFTGEDPSVVTGRGTGIDDETHARKVAVVRAALDLHRPDPADPIGVLAAVGGLEHAALTGFLLGAASLRTPVILDGLIAGSAALVAKAIAPEVLAACVAGHRSAEPGHKAALAKLGLRPLIDLDLRLGEGTGALLALPLVQSAARAMHDVATFDSAGVTEKH